ncbi:MAG: recombinase family protein [Oscillospiraceae bacterium]|nr:recombinase family protein [Oscillospiraceae bacterium]
MARKSRKNTEAAAASETAVLTYRAAGYVRLSVEDNHKKGDSLETQKALLSNFIELSTDIELADFYVDNGATGTTFDRPAFNKMLSDAESGVINCIIVKDLSRLGRSAIDTGYYIEKYLPSLGVRFIAINDDFDSVHDMENGAGVILPLKNMINEAYALDIGRKIRAQQQQAMKSGEYVGAKPPYGYIKAPDNCHKLVVDPETSAVVKQIYGWALERDGYITISRRLNEMGVEAPSVYAQRKGIYTQRNMRDGISWHPRTVSLILSDDVYVGDMVQGKSQTLNHKQIPTTPDKWIIVRDTHEPIVSREMFAAVQAHRAHVFEESKKQLSTPHNSNIFKGKIFCGHCGISLSRNRYNVVSGNEV